MFVRPLRPAMWGLSSICCASFCPSEPTGEENSHPVVSILHYTEAPQKRSFACRNALLRDMQSAKKHSGTHGKESCIEWTTDKDTLGRCDSEVLGEIFHGACRSGISVEGDMACIDKAMSSDVVFMQAPRAKDVSRTVSDHETFKSVKADFYKATRGDGDGLDKPIVFPNGCKYFGQLKNGLGHGKGTFVWPSGQIYDGEYVNGRRHGQGFFIWSDGRWFRGEHRNGLQHGKGQAGDQSGKLIEGVWKNGKRVE